MLKRMNNMTIEEKLGQMFMPSYEATSVTGDIVTLITQYHIGGIFLTGDHVKNKRQIKSMNRNLQYYASNENPLLIASGKKLEQLVDLIDYTFMPSELDMQRVNNRLYTKQLAEVVGQELRDSGINAYTYPNLTSDLSEDPRNEVGQIAPHAVAAVEGLQQSNVLSFVTGFPAAVDINPAINVDRKKSTLYPFHELIRKGADFLTVTENSTYIIDEQIRTRLQFDGVIAYEVPADFSSVAQISEQIVKAVSAGANMIILPFSFERQIKILNKVIEIVKATDAYVEAINDSVEKIFSIKDAYDLQTIGKTTRPLTRHHIKSVKEKIIKKHVQLNY